MLEEDQKRLTAKFNKNRDLDVHNPFAVVSDLIYLPEEDSEDKPPQVPEKQENQNRKDRGGFGTRKKKKMRR